MPCCPVNLTHEITPSQYFKSKYDHWSFLCIYYATFWASLVAQRLKRLPAMRETWVQSLGQEDPLEKEMATHSSILAWRIPWMEEPGGLQSTGLQRVGHNWATSLHFMPPFNPYLNLIKPMFILISLKKIKQRNTQNHCSSERLTKLSCMIELVNRATWSSPPIF